MLLVCVLIFSPSVYHCCIQLLVKSPAWAEADMLWWSGFAFSRATPELAEVAS